MQVCEVIAHIAHLPDVCLGLIQLLTDIVRRGMTEESVEGIDAALQSIQPHYPTQRRTVFVYRLTGLLQAVHGIVGVAYGCIRCVPSSWLNDLSHKLHSVRYLLQIYFIFVKNQMQFIPKELFCGIVSFEKFISLIHILIFEKRSGSNKERIIHILNSGGTMSPDR